MKGASGVPEKPAGDSDGAPARFGPGWPEREGAALQFGEGHLRSVARLIRLVRLKFPDQLQLVGMPLLVLP